MATSVMLPSFAGGELSSSLYARVDLDKYHSGATLLRNFFVDYRGGVPNRPGTRFVAHCASNDEVRLTPFIVSRDQSYILEWSNLLLRVFLREVLVATLATPYLAADLFEIRWAQSADVMTLTHPAYPVYNLKRFSALTFTLTQEAFGTAMPTPAQPTTVSSVSGTLLYVYVITAINAQGEESLASPASGAGSKALDPTADTPVTVAIDWTAVPEAVVYNIYKAGPVQATINGLPTVFGYIGQSKIASFTDNNIGPDFARTPPEHRDPFSPGQITAITVTSGGTGPAVYIAVTITGDGTGAQAYAVPKGGVLEGTVIIQGGINYTAATATPVAGSGTLSVTVDPNDHYPACVAYFQQRRSYAGAEVTPDLIEMSKTGEYSNFDVSPAVLDSDAITISIASREVNQIQHMIPMSTGLVVFTKGNAFLLTGGGGAGAVTPGNIAATPQASTGAGSLPPIVVNYNILFQQYEGTVIRDMTFQWQTSSYYGTDRSMLANHLFDGFSLQDWAFATEPYHLLHVVRDDGKMLVMAYVPDQEVYGWSQYDTQGLFKSVASIPEDKSDAVYTVVSRYIQGNWVNYLERFADREDCCLVEDWFLDSAVSTVSETDTFDLHITAGPGSSYTIFTYDPSGAPNSSFFKGGWSLDPSFQATVLNNQSTAYKGAGNGQDVFGNVWFVTPEVLGDGAMRCVAPNGTILSSTTIAAAITATCTFALANQSPGTSWVATTQSIHDQAGGMAVFNFNGISYGLMFMSKAQGDMTHFSDWWGPTISVLQLHADGSYTVLGCAWSWLGNVVSLGANAGILNRKIDLAGHKTINDPILVAAGMNSTGLGPVFLVFPSIQQILTAKATALNNSVCLWPGSYYNPGDEYYSFGLNQDGFGSGDSEQSIFFMPNSTGGTDVMYYVTQSEMAVTAQPHIVSAFQPTYPSGVLVKATIPTNGTSLTTGFPGRGADTLLPAPAAAPGIFLDTAGNLYNSFTDSGHTYAGAAGNGSLSEYFGVPRIVENLSDGFTVAWYQPWFSDPTYNSGTNWQMKEKLRIQKYSWVTGKFTDIALLVTPTAFINSVHGAGSNPTDVMAITNWQLSVQGDQIGIWHQIGAFGAGASPNYLWRSNIAQQVPVIGEVFTLTGMSGLCATFTITTVVNGQEVVATLTTGQLLTLPNDPSTFIPIAAGSWRYSVPSAGFTGLGHLEGKTVYALADGKAVGPFTVASGTINLGFAAANAVAGLKYSSQFETLRLDTGEPTIQGRRKLIPAVTLRLKCSVGMQVGTEGLTAKQYQPKSDPGGYTFYTPGAANPAAVPFSGDIRVLVQAGWERAGRIVVEQDLPLPVTILGIIPEVTVGDTQR